jgi:hypothetical protein
MPSQTGWSTDSTDSPKTYQYTTNNPITPAQKKRGIIIGSVGGLVILLLALVLVYFVYWKRMKKRRKRDSWKYRDSSTRTVNYLAIGHDGQQDEDRVGLVQPGFSDFPFDRSGMYRDSAGGGRRGELGEGVDSRDHGAATSLLGGPRFEGQNANADVDMTLTPWLGVYDPFGDVSMASSNMGQLSDKSETRGTD